MDNIQILTPISHLFLNEDYSNEIIACSDFLEARERTCELRLKNTTHYHIDFDINIGISESQKKFLREQVKPREHIGTITFQASKDCENAIIKNNTYIPNSQPIDIDEQINRVKASKVIIEDIVGTDRKIGFENNNYYPTGAYDICTSTKFLQRAIEEANLYWLFDVSHAIVTSVNQNISLESYCTKLLSMNKCIQMHLCEPTINLNNGKLAAIDSHGVPSATTTKIGLDYCNDYKIPYITIEFYKDALLLCQYLKIIKSQNESCNNNRL